MRTKPRPQRFLGVTQRRRVASVPNPSTSRESHSVTKSHETPTPKHAASHKQSQSRAKPKPQHFLGVAQRRRVAPVPNPSAFRESQSVTNSHQVPAPKHPENHRASQSRAKPQPHHFLGITQRRRVAPVPNPSTSRESQSVTNSHQAPAPKHPESHRASQSRAKPSPQRFLRVTQRHEVTPGPNSSAFLESHTASQSSTRSQPDSIPRVTNSHKVAPSPSPSASGCHTTQQSSSPSQNDFSESHTIAKSHQAPLTPCALTCRMLKVTPSSARSKFCSHQDGDLCQCTSTKSFRLAISEGLKPRTFGKARQK